jgi:hypothetical protein
MKIFDTNAAWCEMPRWNARPSASQFSETFRKRLRVLAVSFLIAFALGGCGYAGTPPPPNFTVSLQPTSANYRSAGTTRGEDPQRRRTPGYAVPAINRDCAASRASAEFPDTAKSA